MTSEVTLFQGIAEASQCPRGGRKGCFATAIFARSGFLLVLRPVFRWPQLEAPRNEQYTRRRSIGGEPGENCFLGGSDPILSGFSAAQRLRRPGSLPPNGTSRFFAPSPAEL